MVHKILLLFSIQRENTVRPKDKILSPPIKMLEIVLLPNVPIDERL